MRITLQLFTICLLGLVFSSCRKSGPSYLNDSALSTRTGILLDSSKFFLPSKYHNDTMWKDTSLSLLPLKWYSSNYRCFKAPILYNYYLGYENYRFLWIRSFHRPVLITIYKKKKIEINTKILERHPDFWTKIYMPKDTISIHSNQFMSLMDVETARKENPEADSIIAHKYNTRIVADTTYELSINQWNTFKQLVDSSNFWKCFPIDHRPIIDGAEWILEGQNRNKYHYVVTNLPDGNFEKCCTYLIKLSAAKNEDVY